MNASHELLNWFKKNKRVMPWRESVDPYAIWVSEIMLQQTTVAGAWPYFEAFMAKWPTVQNLAAAELDEVLHMWQGLGYYRRARLLHACAQGVVEQLNGKFPHTPEELVKLPGIGPYTAGAIAAIAFGEQAVAIDGNVKRVLSRLHTCSYQTPAELAALNAELYAITPKGHSGDFVQALMELGATICKPRQPNCLECPWQDRCRAFKHSAVDKWPVIQKRTQPHRYGYAFFIRTKCGQVILEKRPDKGLLGGLMGLPTTPWLPEWELPAPSSFGEIEPMREHSGVVKHTFTHFHLHLKILINTPSTLTAPSLKLPYFLCSIEDLSKYALPTLFKKVLKHVMAG